MFGPGPSVFERAARVLQRSLSQARLHIWTDTNSTGGRSDKKPPNIIQTLSFLRNYLAQTLKFLTFFCCFLLIFEKFCVILLNFDEIRSFLIFAEIR